MTGKSQFLECLRGLVPEEARSNLSIAQIAGDYGRFVPRLVGKVLVASDEMPTRAEFASDTFKMLVDGNPIAGREVMKEAVEFRPQAQVVFAGNALPDLGKLDAATQRRLAIVHFLRRIPSYPQTVCVK